MWQGLFFVITMSFSLNYSISASIINYLVFIDVGVTNKNEVYCTGI